MATLFEVWVCGHSVAGVAGSSLAGSMDVCLSVVSVVLCCVVLLSGGVSSVRRADHSSRGVLSTVCACACACVCVIEFGQVQQSANLDTHSE